MGTKTALRVGAAGAALLAGTVVTGTAPAGADGPTCAPTVLPGLADGMPAEVIAMNDTGLVGGDAADGAGVHHAVYWTHDGSSNWTINRIDGPSGMVADFVASINRDGVMVVTGYDENAGFGRGYVFDSRTGETTPLPSLGGDDYDRRINDAGVVAGTSVDTHGVQRAVTWTPPYRAPSKLPTIGGSQEFRDPTDGSHYRFGNGATGINDKGQVVGGTLVGARFDHVADFARQRMWRGVIAPLQEPVEWQANGAPSKLSSNQGQGNAWAINDAGLIVGNIADAETGNPRPTAWINGRPVDMGAPTDSLGTPYGLSQGGWAAGGYWDSNFTVSRAFVWSQSTGLRALDPPDGLHNSWSHTASDVLRQVGGDADNGDYDHLVESAVLWQC